MVASGTSVKRGAPVSFNKAFGRHTQESISFVQLRKAVRDLGLSFETEKQSLVDFFSAERVDREATHHCQPIEIHFNRLACFRRDVMSHFSPLTPSQFLWRRKHSLLLSLEPRVTWQRKRRTPACSICLKAVCCLKIPSFGGTPVA